MFGTITRAWRNLGRRIAARDDEEKRQNDAVAKAEADLTRISGRSDEIRELIRQDRQARYGERASCDRS